MSAANEHQFGDEEDGTLLCCHIPMPASLGKPIEVEQAVATGVAGQNPFFLWPWLSPFLLKDDGIRDHCANERTFLSYLRLSVTMAVVSMAIVLSFHLKKKASPLELLLAKPLGAIFWCLSLGSLGVGLANYVRTLNGYSRRVAIVQAGRKTQTVLAILTISIVGACIALLVMNKFEEDDP